MTPRGTGVISRMLVLLIDHGCRGARGECAHPDADRLAAHGVRVVVADVSNVFPQDAVRLSDEALATAREEARQSVYRAVDEGNPDVILVLHAGAIADLAVETGVPLVMHAALADLEAAGEGIVRDLVASSLGAADIVLADDARTERSLRRDEWVSADVEVEIVPRSDAAKLVAACRRASDRRGGWDGPSVPR
jgi:hypothetical protein